MGLRRPRPSCDLPARPTEPAEADALAYTTIGTVAHPWRAQVDPYGRVVAPNRRWTLDWCIGADDRWHVPSREPAVRQHLIDLSPVVETAVRVPSGDVIQRAFAVAGVDGRADAAIVEIVNRSPVPVAVALLVRPSTSSRIKRVALEGDTMVVVDGDPALFLPRRPRRFLATTRVTGDVMDRVVSATGRAAETDPPARCRHGMAQAAVVYPLPHGASLRVAIPLGAVPRGGHDRPISAEPAEAVARGWAAQARRGMDLLLPEGRLADAVEVARRSLLLTHRGADVGRGGVEPFTFRDAAYLLSALDQYGFHDEVAEVLESYPSRLRRARADDRAWAVSTCGAHWRLTRDDRWRGAPVITPPSDSSVDASTPFGLARLALAGFERGDPHALAHLQAIVNFASSTFSWSERDGPAAAAFLIAVRNMLLRERRADAHVDLAVCSMLPDDWRGQPLEVHDAPTEAGRLSFAIRWHGPRPALLWELTSHDPDYSIRLSAPGLDPMWSSVEPRGDALLAGAEAVVE